MFNKEDDKAKILVELVMSDSRRLKGNMLIPPISTLARQLNNDTLFMEFEDFEGGLHMVAKQAMGEIILAKSPKAAKLEAKPLDQRNTPYLELGLAPNATPQQIEEGYAAMMRKYDPEAIASLNLPDEVLAYYTAKRANIEAAYKFLAPKQDNEAA
jgi:DnaJ-domain-containing protein 1